MTELYQFLTLKNPGALKRIFRTQNLNPSALYENLRKTQTASHARQTRSNALDLAPFLMLSTYPHYRIIWLRILFLPFEGESYPLSFTGEPHHYRSLPLSIPLPFEACLLCFLFPPLALAPGDWVFSFLDSAFEAMALAISPPSVSFN